MFRFVIVLLALANGVYFAWTQGHLAILGWVPAAQTEPARLAAQIKPEQISLLSTNEVRRLDLAASAPPPKPTECLVSPLLPDKTALAAGDAAASLPPQSWQLEPFVQEARWIVYMGKYTDPQVLAKKKSELRQVGVIPVALQAAKLEPGISLGGYTSQALANSALSGFNARGVRTAKVVQELAPVSGQVLRLGAVDDTLRAQLGPVISALGSAALRPCKSA